MTFMNIHLLHILYFFSLMRTYTFSGIKALGKFVTEKLEMEKNTISCLIFSPMV